MSFFKRFNDEPTQALVPTLTIVPDHVASYPSGHQRDAACVRIVESLEQKLLSHHRMQNIQKVDTSIFLLEEGPLLISSPLK